MTGAYEKLAAALEDKTAKAARFRRVVLHIHSPHSYDFGTVECDSTLNNRSQYLEPGGEILYLDHLKNKFDLVSITDHMKVEYACRLSAKAGSDSALCVLPGVELNVRLSPPLNSLRLHFLAIFPESKSVGEIERIFPGAIPDDSTRTGQEEIAVENLPEFVRRIRREHGGLCIAAHVDNDNGIRMLFRQTGKETLALFSPDGKVPNEEERAISEAFKEYLVAARFDGIEVRKPSDRKHYTWITNPEKNTKHHVPVFLTFDAHSIEALQRPERATYVKMSEVSWQGLADAIKFPLTRVRFSDERVPPPYVVGIEILSPAGVGFFPELCLGFVENLNCIIGPRGSGKSTIVDAFRYTFGYNRTLDELESKDLASAVLRRQERNLENCIVRVAYRVSEDEVHFLEATYDPKSPYATKVYDIDGNPVLVTDVERDGKYPLRLFGWSEIETLGRDPARQRELLDKLVPEVSRHEDRKESLIGVLGQNAKSVILGLDQLDEILQTNEGEVEYYEEYREEFERLNTPEVQGLFASLDQQRKRLDFLQKLDDALQAFKSRVEEALPIPVDRFRDSSEAGEFVLLTSLEDALLATLEEDEDLEVWWNQVAINVLNLLEYQNRIGRDLADIMRAISELSSLLRNLVSLTRAEIEKIEREIRQQLSSDPGTQVLADLRDKARERLEQVEKVRERYNRSLENVQSLLDERSRIVQGIVKCHRAITELRAKKKTEVEGQLNEFQTEDMIISIDFVPDGDRDRFANHLQNLRLLSEANTKFRHKRWPDLIADACTPVEFARIVLERDPETLVVSREIEGRTCQIDPEDARKIAAALYPYGRNEQAGIDTIDREKLIAIMEIQQIDWDDKEHILRSEQPVDQSSPGQRSSAMLPLIALAESVPLIIDQPEDNLDNRLVGQVLVDILAKLKEKRQIIVTTHNPNIVVLGDAEQVIVLDAISDVKGTVQEPQASVDHPDIVKSIVELLEGGEDAFETRRKRYLEG